MGKMSIFVTKQGAKKQLEQCFLKELNSMCKQSGESELKKRGPAIVA